MKKTTHNNIHTSPHRQNPSDPNQLLRLVDVLKLLPIGKSTWWAWVANGTAPEPIRLGRCTCWRYSDVIAFIEGCE